VLRGLSKSLQVGIDMLNMGDIQEDDHPPSKSLLANLKSSSKLLLPVLQSISVL
jgi:hypothetical protein